MKLFTNDDNFQPFRESPDTYPLLILNNSGKFFFANQPFRKIEGFENVKNIKEIKSEPNLQFLIQNFFESGYSNINFDLCLYRLDKFGSLNFSAFAEKIIINKNELILLTLKSAEENRKLEEKINNLHDALEYGKVSVIITNEKGIISYATRSFEEILNSNIENLYNKFLPVLLSSYLTAKEIGELEQAIKKKVEWSKTISTVTEGGNHSFSELNLRPVYDELTGVKNFILTANVITNYILTNRIIKRSEELLKSIIDNITGLLLILSSKEDKLYFENANDNFCDTFKIIKKEAYKKDIGKVFNNFLFPVISSSIKKAEKKKVSYIQFDVNENGIIRQYGGKVSFVDDPMGEQRLYIISLKDLTELLQYEEKLKKAYERESYLNKIKTSFLETMSHEIRTPFNTILSYSDLIDEYTKNEDYVSVRELLNSSKDVLKRVLNLFNNIVEVSQIQAGEVELERVILNSNQVLKTAYSKKIDEAKEKGLNFILDLEKRDLLIETDWVKFEKILLSLIDNSIKYTDEGEIILRSDSVKDKVIITVSDTGKGIEESKLNKITEPFTQEEEGYERNYFGAGLGLTIASGLTKILGGKIKINSSHQKGTKITLTFPLYKSF